MKKWKVKKPELKAKPKKEEKKQAPPMVIFSGTFSNGHPQLNVSTSNGKQNPISTLMSTLTGQLAGTGKNTSSINDNDVSSLEHLDLTQTDLMKLVTNLTTKASKVVESKRQRHVSEPALVSLVLQQLGLDTHEAREQALIKSRQHFRDMGSKAGAVEVTWLPTILLASHPTDKVLFEWLEEIDFSYPTLGSVPHDAQDHEERIFHVLHTATMYRMSHLVIRILRKTYQGKLDKVSALFKEPNKLFLLLLQLVEQVATNNSGMQEHLIWLALHGGIDWTHAVSIGDLRADSVLFSVDPVKDMKLIDEVLNVVQASNVTKEMRDSAVKCRQQCSLAPLQENAAPFTDKCLCHLYRDTMVTMINRPLFGNATLLVIFTSWIDHHRKHLREKWNDILSANGHGLIKSSEAQDLVQRYQQLDVLQRAIWEVYQAQSLLSRLFALPELSIAELEDMEKGSTLNQEEKDQSRSRQEIVAQLHRYVQLQVCYSYNPLTNFLHLQLTFDREQFSELMSNLTFLNDLKQMGQPSSAFWQLLIKRLATEATTEKRKVIENDSRSEPTCASLLATCPVLNVAVTLFTIPGVTNVYRFLHMQPGTIAEPCLNPALEALPYESIREAQIRYQHVKKFQHAENQRGNFLSATLEAYNPMISAALTYIFTAAFECDHSTDRKQDLEDIHSVVMKNMVPFHVSLDHLTLTQIHQAGFSNDVYNILMRLPEHIRKIAQNLSKASFASRLATTIGHPKQSLVKPSIIIRESAGFLVELTQMAQAKESSVNINRRLTDRCLRSDDQVVEFRALLLSTLHSRERQNTSLFDPFFITAIASIVSNESMNHVVKHTSQDFFVLYKASLENKNSLIRMVDVAILLELLTIHLLKACCEEHLDADAVYILVSACTKSIDLPMEELYTLRALPPPQNPDNTIIKQPSEHTSNNVIELEETSTVPCVQQSHTVGNEIDREQHSSPVEEQVAQLASSADSITIVRLDVSLEEGHDSNESSIPSSEVRIATSKPMPSGKSGATESNIAREDQPVGIRLSKSQKRAARRKRLARSEDEEKNTCDIEKLASYLDKMKKEENEQEEATGNGHKHKPQSITDVDQSCSTASNAATVDKVESPSSVPSMEESQRSSTVDDNGVLQNNSSAPYIEPGKGESDDLETTDEPSDEPTASSANNITMTTAITLGGVEDSVQPHEELVEAHEAASIAPTVLTDFFAYGVPPPDNWESLEPDRLGDYAAPTWEVVEAEELSNNTDSSMNGIKQGDAVSYAVPALPNASDVCMQDSQQPTNADEVFESAQRSYSRIEFGPTNPAPEQSSTDVQPQDNDDQEWFLPAFLSFLDDITSDEPVGDWRSKNTTNLLAAPSARSTTASKQEPPRNAPPTQSRLPLTRSDGYDPSVAPPPQYIQSLFQAQAVTPLTWQNGHDASTDMYGSSVHPTQSATACYTDSMRDTRSRYLTSNNHMIPNEIYGTVHRSSNSAQNMARFSQSPIRPILQHYQQHVPFHSTESMMHHHQSTPSQPYYKMEMQSLSAQAAPFIPRQASHHQLNHHHHRQLYQYDSYPVDVSHDVTPTRRSFYPTRRVSPPPPTNTSFYPYRQSHGVYDETPRNTHEQAGHQERAYHPHHM